MSDAVWTASEIQAYLRDGTKLPSLVNEWLLDGDGTDTVGTDNLSVEDGAIMYDHDDFHWRFSFSLNGTNLT